MPEAEEKLAPAMIDPASASEENIETQPEESEMNAGQEEAPESTQSGGAENDEDEDWNDSSSPTGLLWYIDTSAAAFQSMGDGVTDAQAVAAVEQIMAEMQSKKKQSKSTSNASHHAADNVGVSKGPDFEEVQLERWGALRRRVALKGWCEAVHITYKDAKRGRGDADRTDEEKEQRKHIVRSQLHDVVTGALRILAHGGGTVLDATQAVQCCRRVCPGKSGGVVAISGVLDELRAAGVADSVVNALSVELESRGTESTCLSTQKLGANERAEYAAGAAEAPASTESEAASTNESGEQMPETEIVVDAQVVKECAQRFWEDKEKLVEPDTSALLGLWGGNADGSDAKGTDFAAPMMSVELLECLFEKAAAKHRKHVQAEQAHAAVLNAASAEARGLFEKLDADGSGALQGEEVLALARWAVERTYRPPPPPRPSAWRSLEPLQKAVSQAKDKLKESASSSKGELQKAVERAEAAYAHRRAVLQAGATAEAARAAEAVRWLPATALAGTSIYHIVATIRRERAASGGEVCS